MSFFSILESMWGEAPRTTMYILNRVSKKSVPSTQFELQTGRKPNLRYLHIQRCPTKIRVFNPYEKKLDPSIIFGYFIDYPEKSKGY